MFALDHTIEAVQNAKKAAVNHFIRNEDLAKSFNALVEAETAFAKAAVKVSTDAATKFGDELTRQTKQIVDQVNQNDWAKSNPFFTEITKWTAPVTKKEKNA